MHDHKGGIMKRLSVLILVLFIAGCTGQQVIDWFEKDPKAKYNQFVHAYSKFYDQVDVQMKAGIESERLTERYHALVEVAPLIDEYGEYAEMDFPRHDLEPKIMMLLQRAAP